MTMSWDEAVKRIAVTIPMLRAIWSGAIRLAVFASTAYMMWVISEPVRDDFVALWESGDMFIRLFTFLMAIVAIVALVHVLQESRGSGSSDSLRVSQIASSILTQRISKTQPAVDHPNWLVAWPLIGWIIGAYPCFKLGWIGLGCWIIDAPIVGPLALLWWNFGND